nr:hypothetical protein [Gemmatimonadaceae bacterium]
MPDRPPHAPGEDTLAPDDPLAAFLPALRGDVAVRPTALDAVKAAVRADAVAGDAELDVPAPAAARTAVPPRGAALRWWVAPQALRLSPMAAAALLLVVAGGAFGVGRLATRATPFAGGDTTAAAPIVSTAAASASPRVVRFTLRAPTASRVTLVGDFNGWDPDAAPLARRGEEWTIAIPVLPGRHAYGFIVDGAEWIPDPA